MEKFDSVLKFDEYIVNEVYYKRNFNYKKLEDEIDLKLNIVPKIKADKNTMIVNLITYIFEDAEENNFPFEMRVDISGYFVMQGEQIERFTANAIAILYPYIRAIVSTYTASANISPLILPAINVNAMLENKKDKK